MQEPFLVWPKFGAKDLIFLLAVITGLAIPFVLLAFYRIREARRLNRWILIANYANKQGLDLRETGLLKSFFEGLSSPAQEAVFHDRAHFRSLLYAYLRQHHELDERTGVRTVDKMFPDIKHWHAVLSASDLQPGEICGLEFGSRHVVGAVLDIEEDSIVVSFAPDSPVPHVEEEVGLYIYRPRIGGYLLQTRAERVWRGGMKILFMGKVEDQGEQHLMARVNLPVEFTPWSDLPALQATGAPTAEGDLQFENVLAGEEEALVEPPVAAVPDSPVAGTCDRISDRGLLFRSTDPRLLTFLVHGLWEISALIGDGFQLSCRGRILPTRPGSDRYVFRYIDLPENTRRVLLAEIKLQGGEREKLV